MPELEKFDADDMPGFEVVPDSLRDASKRFGEASDKWQEAHQVLADCQLKPEDLGALVTKKDRVVDSVKAYNTALEDCLLNLAKSTFSLQKGELAMKQIASMYAEQDFQYYKHFGYNY